MKTKRWIWIGALVALLATAALSQTVNGLAPGRKTTPIATNLWSATTKITQVYSITAVNVSATDLWLFVVDTNTAVIANNTLPSLAPVLVTAGKTGFYDFGASGCRFGAGVTVATSTTPASLTNSTASFIITVTFDGNPN